jgi:hypothetical protein
MLGGPHPPTGARRIFLVTPPRTSTPLIALRCTLDAAAVTHARQARSGVARRTTAADGGTSGARQPLPPVLRSALAVVAHPPIKNPAQHAAASAVAGGAARPGSRRVLLQAADPPPPSLPSCASLLSGEPSNGTQYVDASSGRIYRYVATGGLDYSQVQAACQALSYGSLASSGYAVSWNTWVAVAPLLVLVMLLVWLLQVALLVAAACLHACMPSCIECAGILPCNAASARTTACCLLVLRHIASMATAPARHRTAAAPTGPPAAATAMLAQVC